MKRVWITWAVVALALPALWAEDPPKDGGSPKEQYDALVKEFNSERSKLVPQINKAKGEEQQKLIEQYQSLGKKFAEKFSAVAEADPKSPVAVDALFWLVQNGGGGEAATKATEKLIALVGEMPLKELTAKLRAVRVSDPKFFDAVIARAEKDEKDEGAPELLAWVATSASFMPVGRQAAKKLIDKNPDHPAVARVLASLAGGRGDSSETIKLVLEKSKNPTVKTAAAMAMGQSLARRIDALADKPEEADKLAAEAEKYFTMVIDELAKDAPAAKKAAEQELKSLRTLRVGKEAPEIAGGDLDGKEFKLSDYRGKVILLDFWGQW